MSSGSVCGRLCLGKAFKRWLHCTREGDQSVQETVSASAICACVCHRDELCAPQSAAREPYPTEGVFAWIVGNLSSFLALRSGLTCDIGGDGGVGRCSSSKRKVFRGAVVVTSVSSLAPGSSTFVLLTANAKVGASVCAESSDASFPHGLFRILLIDGLGGWRGACCCSMYLFGSWVLLSIINSNLGLNPPSIPGCCAPSSAANLLISMSRSLLCSFLKNHCHTYLLMGAPGQRPCCSSSEWLST